MNLLKPSFWFSIRPDALTPLANKTLIGLCVALALIGIGVLIYKKIKPGAYNKALADVSSLTLTNAVIGIVLFFFNYEMIPFLSARFWYLIWLVEFGIWFYFIIKAFLDIPKKKEALEKEKEFKKYIP